jgi:transposase
MKAYSLDLQQKIARACEQPSGSQRAIVASFEALEQAGSRLLYLPPYAPELSPIERCCSQLKTALRAAKARTREALDHAIGQTLATITVSDTYSGFLHCGDALQ